MKKLLLLINTAILLLALAGCGNNSPAKKEKASDAAAPKNDSMLATDTSKTKMEVSPVGTVGTGTGLNKDSVKAPSNTATGIIHHSMNQQKIDSIKAAKNKGKK